MTCGSCGNQNPPGARYCTRCGTELAEPTPIAAVAAAANGTMARAARAQAANAAQADPAALKVQAANQASAEPAWRQPPGLREERDVPVSPAYNAAPARRGIAALLLALCAVAAVAVVTVWQLGSSRAPADTATAERAAGVAVPAAPVPPPAEVTSPLGAATPSETAAQRQAESSQGGTGGESAEPVEITPLPARPAPARGARRPAAEKAATPTPPPAPGASPAPTAPVTRAPAARAPATVPSVAPVNDRWARMNDELSRCTREDFITRVICGQRVRFRYCEGYWGKVDVCPASPAPERGQ
jgi:hypothetical protein